MAVMKSVQIMSESSKSFEDAIESAVKRTGKSVKNIRSANIQNQSVTIDGNMTTGIFYDYSHRFLVCSYNRSGHLLCIVV